MFTPTVTLEVIEIANAQDVWATTAEDLVAAGLAVWTTCIGCGDLVAVAPTHDTADTVVCQGCRHDIETGVFFL